MEQPPQRTLIPLASPANDYPYPSKAVHEPSPADSGKSSASAPALQANACDNSGSSNVQQPSKHLTRASNNHIPPNNNPASYNSCGDPEVALWGQVLLSNQDPTMEGRGLPSFAEHDLLDMYESGATSDQFVFGADHHLQASWAAAPAKFDLLPSYMHLDAAHHEINGDQYPEISTMDIEEQRSRDEGTYSAMDAADLSKGDLHDAETPNRAATPVEDRLSSTANVGTADSAPASSCQTNAVPKLQPCSAAGDQEGQAARPSVGDHPTGSSACALPFLISSSSVSAPNNQQYNFSDTSTGDDKKLVHPPSGGFDDLGSMSTNLWSFQLFKPSSEHERQHLSQYVEAGCTMSSPPKMSAHPQQLVSLPLQQVQSENNVCGTAPFLLNPVSSYTNLLLEQDPPPLFRNVGASSNSFKLAAPTNPIPMMIGCSTRELPPVLSTMVTQFPHSVFSTALDAADASWKKTNYLSDYSNTIMKNPIVNKCHSGAAQSLSTTTTTSSSSTSMDQVGIKRSSNPPGRSGMQTTQPCVSSCDNFSDYLACSMDGTSATAPSEAAECHVIKKPRVAEVSEVALNMHATSKQQAPKKEKLGDRIATLQQLVAPFGKTDTASVLLEAIGYIKFLQDQVQALSSPYMQKSPSSSQKTIIEGVRRSWGNLHVNPSHALLHKNASRSPTSTDEAQDLSNGGMQDLRSRGLCLVPISCTLQVANAKVADYWSAAYSGVGTSFRPF